jgi:hypothetical protein
MRRLIPLALAVVLAPLRRHSRREEQAEGPDGPYTPTPADFALNIITLSQDCFGSAGCNITFRIEVSYVGAQQPDDDKTYQVVYEVRGGEDTKIGSFELKDERYTVPSEDFISTPPNPTLTAVVTSVVEN